MQESGIRIYYNMDSHPSQGECMLYAAMYEEKLWFINKTDSTSHYI